MGWNRFSRRKNKFYKYNNRDYNDKQYKKFLAQVRKRDKNICQMPNCGADSPLQVHHIRTWANNIHLRYDVKNGILLCKKCHELIKNKETYYEELFTRIVLRNYEEN